MKIGNPIPRRHSRIEIIPLIDIMFFLLATFMLVSLNMSKLSAVKVEAPRAGTGKNDISPDVFSIALTRQGRIFVGDTDTPLDGLGVVLSNRLVHRGTNAPVYITGDKDTAHGLVLQVLDRLRRVGIQRVSFSVTPESE